MTAASSTRLTAIISAIDRLSPALKGIQRTVRLTSKTLRDVGREGGRLLSSVGVSSVVLGGGLVAAARSVISVNAEFEKFQTILETIEGSSEKARQSMAWVQDFAARTPFELAEVTDAFVKLKAYGIDPQKGALEAAGNASAAMGKSVMQAVEALADAMTGENERLKEFGIRAEKNGEQIVYTWTENGKTMAAKAKASSKEQIENVLKGIWNRRYGGAMDKLSGTWTGIWSNLKDQSAKFQKQIGDAGIFEALKTEMAGILATINRMEDDGTLKRVAQEISDGLVETLRELVHWVKSVDWRGFMADMRSVAAGVRDFVGWMGGIKNVLIGIGALFLAGPISSVLGILGALWRFGAGLVLIAGGWKAVGVAILAVGKIFAVVARALLFTPIGLALTAIAAAAYLIYANWDKVKAWLGVFFEWLSGAASAVSDAVSSAFDSAASAVRSTWESIKGWFSGFFTWISSTVASVAGSLSGLVPDWARGAAGGNAPAGGSQKPAIAATPLAQSGAMAFAAGRQQLTGDMTVRFENAPPGMRVSQGTTNQPGVSMTPDVGYRSLALAPY